VDEAVGGGAFLFLAVHGEGAGAGKVLEEMARAVMAKFWRALAGMCGVGASLRVYMAPRGRRRALTPPLKTSRC
jgi:hypothetical protein